MDNNQYSVVIRTLGTAGEKYQRLLNSIAAQTIQPKHIYVVMADGYALPPEQHGTEEFVFTKKGMWNQRIYGIEYCAAHGDELQLACDDDIAFEPDFVERLMAIMEEHNADVLVPSIANSSNYAVSLPKKMLRRFLRSGYEDSHQSYAVRINSSAGFSVIGGGKLQSINVLQTQSAHFNCFLMKPDITKLRFADEGWLDETPYAFADDQVFFYKIYLAGYRQFIVYSPTIIHLDHGSSSPDRLQRGAYANGRNLFIFWHRFLYSRAATTSDKVKLQLGMAYRLFAYGTFETVFTFVRRKNLIGSYLSGVVAGVKYTRG